MKGQDLRVLEWFFALVNADLNAMQPAEELKISTEANLIISGIDPWVQSTLDENLRKMAISLWTVRSFTQGNKLDLKFCQNKIRTAIELIYRSIGESAKPVKSVDIETGKVEEGKFPPTLDVVLPYHEPFYLEVTSDLNLSDPTLIIQFKSLTAEENLYIKFLNELNGIPLKAIRQCHECKAWFLHLSKREREFCSNRCAARKASRDRRADIKSGKKKDKYKKELKAGAKRARASYESKVKKEHPKATVARRPRKHKD